MEETTTEVGPSPKPMRSMQEVQKDYSQWCAQAGENTYRIKVLEGQLNLAYQKISEFNQEADAITKAKGEANGQS